MVRAAARYLCITGGEMMARTKKQRRRTGRKGFSEYLFTIEDFTPETFPLSRLAEYLKELAVLFGHSESVHLVAVEDGSAAQRFLVNTTDEIKLRERLQAVRAKEGPEEAMRANRMVNEMLREDNTKAAVVDPSRRKILPFPGRELNKLLEYGPITQIDTLEGVPIEVGGKKEWVPVHVEDDRRVVRICHAKRSMAKEIAKHLFTSTVRIHGTARWVRHRSGEWEMKDFRAKGFEVLPETDLRGSLERIRAIPAKWKEIDNPLDELMKIRHGTDS
jgi:hypothetical protein